MIVMSNADVDAHAEWTYTTYFVENINIIKFHFCPLLKLKVFNEVVIKCNIKYLCKECRKRRAKLCRIYHLYRRPMVLVEDI